MKCLAVSVFLLATILGTTQVAKADVPRFITYSGRLSDGTAWGQSTVVALTFRLYGQASDGQALWQQSFPAVNVEDGYFSVILGDGDNPATGPVETDYNVTDIFAAHDQTWITMCVGVGCTPVQDLSPRQAVGSVPYAVRAGNADYLSDAAAHSHASVPHVTNWYTMGQATALCKNYDDKAYPAWLGPYNMGKSGNEIADENGKQCVGMYYVHTHIGLNAGHYQSGDKNCAGVLDRYAWPYWSIYSGNRINTGFLGAIYVVCIKD